MDMSNKIPPNLTPYMSYSPDLNKEAPFLVQLPFESKRFQTLGEAKQVFQKEAIQHSLKMVGYRAGEIFAKGLGVLLFPLTATAGLVIGTGVGGIVEAVKNLRPKRILIQNPDEKREKKSETLEGLKYGAIGLFMLGEMAAEKARELKAVWGDTYQIEPKNKKNKTGGEEPIYEGL